VADKAGDRDTHKTDPYPPKRDNPTHKTNKISESGIMRDGRAMSQKSSKKTRGGHHKK
jgi:hypothetical protein